MNITKNKYTNILGWTYHVETDIVLVFKGGKLLKTITKEELADLIVTRMVK
jgi:hypothetical protein